MYKPFCHRSSALICLCLLAGLGDVFAAEPNAEGLAFFEKKIRPVLVENCYKCHSANSEKVKGELLLDTRAGIRKGGESGHAVVPKNLEESLLVEAIRYGDEETAMPPKKKLPESVIAAQEASGHETRVMDLTEAALDSDYSVVLEEIFAADSVQVW